MASASPEPSGQRDIKALLSWWMLALCWLPIGIIGALHYTTHTDDVWVHHLLRRAYYLPIVLAGFQGGLRGGVLASSVVSLTYVPHAFFHLGHLAHTDPGNDVDKLIEIILYNAIGLVGGYLSDRDHRRRQELEAALDEQHRLQQQLVRAGRLGALGEVVAGIAHEVKNPLHALKGTAEVISPLIPEDAEERRLWNVHVSELERLERVANRFLSFSSPEPSHMARLDLRKVATRLTELVEADARKRGIRVTLDTPEREATVSGDRDQLAQVAMNICLNAMKAIGDKGGQIRVIVLPWHSDAMHCLRIENDGPPLEDSEKENLFNPFHGSDPSSTGLGLSIAQRLAERHGGYIEAENAGLGVRFDVRLPALGKSKDQSADSTS